LERKKKQSREAFGSVRKGHEKIERKMQKKEKAVSLRSHEKVSRLKGITQTIDIQS